MSVLWDVVLNLSLLCSLFNFWFDFIFFNYPKQHFKIFTVQNGQQCSMGWYCRRSVWLSLWRNCLWPFLKTSSNSKCSSHSPLWAPPIPVHLLPPLYLCLVSREKNKAPYVLVLENTWINVLFFVQKKICCLLCFYTIYPPVSLVRGFMTSLYSCYFIHTALKLTLEDF